MNSNNCKSYIFIISLLMLIKLCVTLPDPGKWDYNLTMENTEFVISKSMNKDGMLRMRLNCESTTSSNLTIPPTITISWVLIHVICWNIGNPDRITKDSLEGIKHENTSEVSFKSQNKVYKCSDHIAIEEKFPVDGLYLFGFVITEGTGFNLGVHVEMKNEDGYLSASDWPFLPFYGFMCIFYVALGFLWMIMSFIKLKDMLRVQFWIGGVILLGMMEKATFYAEYHSINSTGYRVQGAMLFAEWVSCAKRTLARMLVIIVSLGFGIVKPRLGSALHRVVGVGMLYFFLAASEAYLRVTHTNSVQGREVLVASVPLAILDSAICWWIFSALVNTTRTLRLRRNEVKFNLYRHFTNTLIFAVVASVIFMLYTIKSHRVACLTIWKDIWLQEAYWHILFSSLLLVIMILWRPTNNNQRYAFVPMLETGDDEEEEHLVNDAYGVKVRVHYQKTTPPKQRSSVEDDLKWLEENITIDPPLPVLDSDEELANTRFEVSKMQ